MLSEYELGDLFSHIEAAMPYVVVACLLGAFSVFRYCKSKEKDENELRKAYRSLAFLAECCGILSLFAIVTFFGRSLIAHDKDLLSDSRQASLVRVWDLSSNIQQTHCRKRDSTGEDLSSMENLTAICAVANLKGWKYDDNVLTLEKVHEIERLSVLTGPPQLMFQLDELKSAMQEVERTQRHLWMNHGPAAAMKQTIFSVVLALLALCCAFISATFKTGKASHEWFYGRRKK